MTGWPVNPIVWAAALVLFLIAAPAPASAADAGGADPVQQDLEAIFECRAPPAKAVAVCALLRAAMYGDPQQRPSLMQQWWFRRTGEDETSVLSIEMPVALTAHGISTRRLLADDMGIAMPIDAETDERIVSTNGMRLRASALRSAPR